MEPNQVNKRGVTPISAAAHKGSIGLLAALVDGGADVNFPNASGSTALIQAGRLILIYQLRHCAFPLCITVLQ